MSGQPSLLFYCQHSLGLGHAVRSLALATALASDFRVVLACGGEVPDSLALPSGVELLQLPALHAVPGGELVGGDHEAPLQGRRRRRRELLLDALRTLRPRVLVVELFPFGRRKFADELVPLVQAADEADPRPVLACSVRDILVGREPDQEAHDTLSCVLANRYFDAVLVHSDASFARLEESFRPTVKLRVPVFHTGFVVPERDVTDGGGRDPRVIVSTGGGRFGEPLLQAALEARTVLPRHLRLELLAGPFLPDAAWRTLEAEAEGLEGVTLRRAVPDLAAELATAAASVSQCGYNTALDLLQTRVPALVVPFAAKGEDEQTRRARRLERLGAVRVLEPERLDGPALAKELQDLLTFEPRPLDLDVDGARATVELLSRLAARPAHRAEVVTA